MARTTVEVADAINGYLQAFENDPAINAAEFGRKPFHMAFARASGAWVNIQFTMTGGSFGVRKADAEKYLEWLEAGNVGTIRTMKTSAV